MARSEVLPAVFAMADAHQAFSNRDVRRVAVGGVAQHDVVAAVGRVSPTDRERERERERRSRSFELRRTNVDRSAVRIQDSTTTRANYGPKKKEFGGD